jgi:uncharacterized membrane protein YsdA (DUF1294 family)/cold shock CspA family protein
MRKEGVIVRWDDVKRFGFIRSSAASQDLFVHVRDFRAAQLEAPHPGLRVSFEDIHVGGKGPRAVAVQLIEGSHAGKLAPPGGRATSRRHARRDRTGAAPRSGARLAFPLMAAYGLTLLGLVWQRQLPWWVLPLSLALNVLAFFTYWQDKHAARQGHWRISEDVLHLWSLAGGWPGAWLAQQVLRHKSAKGSFRSMYWATVVIHCSAAFGMWWFLHAPG